jgi:hypothetical protein
VGERGGGHQRALLAVQELREQMRAHVRGELFALRLRELLIGSGVIVKLPVI